MDGSHLPFVYCLISWGASGHAAPLADQLIGFDDLLRALLGVRHHRLRQAIRFQLVGMVAAELSAVGLGERSEEHTSELQSRRDLVCRLLLEKKNRESRSR